MNPNLKKLGHKLSKQSGHSWARHAVIVIRGGNIISTGYNHAAIHAEWNALNALWPSERKGTTVISLRFTKTGNLACARPCPKCLKFMLDNGVKCVKFSDSEGKMVKVRLSQGMDYTGTRYPTTNMEALRKTRSGAAYYGLSPFNIED